MPVESLEGANPFLRYRVRLDSYQRWIDVGGADAEFVSTIENLDDAIGEVEGHGFLITPVSDQPEMASTAGLPDGAALWVKDETNNVGGSHKARHLFGLLLHAAVDARSATNSQAELAIASCGNAALGAAVVAKAAHRRLRVFIPVWADEAVVNKLDDLGATIERCERREGESGDPCYLRFLEAVDRGSAPFSVQGTIVPATLDGGRTIGWELAEQLAIEAGGMARLDVVAVQVGGGALGSSLAAGLRESVEAGWLAAMPRVSAVQTEACAPLRRAWDLLTSAGSDEQHGDAVSLLWSEPSRFMWPWDDVGTSVASGILDDVTYDWQPLTEAMLMSGGSPVVVDEATVAAANRIGRELTGIDVCPTGTAGLAGLMGGQIRVDRGDEVAVLFTGVRR